MARRLIFISLWIILWYNPKNASARATAIPPARPPSVNNIYRSNSARVAFQMFAHTSCFNSTNKLALPFLYCLLFPTKDLTTLEVFVSPAYFVFIGPYLTD